MIFLVKSHVRAVPAKVTGTNLSASLSAFPSTEDFSFSDSSIISTIFSYREEPPTFFTAKTNSPSSKTLPAYRYPPAAFRTGRGSPVREDWFTIPSPSSTTPSKGMIFPMRTITWSPSSIFLESTSTSCSPLFNQTFSVFKAILRARSPTDFLCVHSSNISPTPRRNMTEEAVLKSLRKTEMPIADASNTATSSFLLAILFHPSFR